MRISIGFLKSSVIYTVAGSLPVASAIILLPFYSAFLSTADFGALSIYLSFSLLTQYITTYSFDISLYIHFHEYKSDKVKLSKFVSSAFVLMLLIGCGVATILTLCGNLIFQSVFSETSIQFYPYGLLAAATGILQALFKVYSNLLQSREKPVVFFWTNIVFFSLIVALSVGGLLQYPNTLVGPVGGRFIAAFLLGMWALYSIFREFGIHFDFKLLGSSLSFNLYTFIYQLLQWVINYFDRILLLYFLPLSTIGVYDFAIKCLLIIEFLLNGLHNSFYPKVVSTLVGQTEKKSSIEINRYYHGLIGVILLLICFCILTFPWAIETFVVKEEYHASVWLLPYLSLIYVFRLMRSYFAVPYGILKYSKPLPFIYLGVSVLKICGILLLVKPLGINGVIISSLAGAALEVVLLRYVIRAKFQFKFNFLKIVGVPVFMLALVLFLEPLFGTTYPSALHFFYLFVCAAVLLWVYRNEIKQIRLKTLLKR